MGLIRCPECGTQISDKARECPKCGFPIYLEVNSSMENKICDFCGSENEHYAKFCTNCGAGLARTAEKEPASEPMGACIYCGKLFPQGDIVEIEGKNYCRECVPRLLAEQKNLNANMAYNYAPPPPAPQYSNYVPAPDYNQDYSSHKSDSPCLMYIWRVYRHPSVLLREDRHGHTLLLYRRYLRFWMDHRYHPCGTWGI